MTTLMDSWIVCILLIFVFLRPMELEKVLFFLGKVFRFLNAYRQDLESYFFSPPSFEDKTVKQDADLNKYSATHLWPSSFVIHHPISKREISAPISC